MLTRTCSVPDDASRLSSNVIFPFPTTSDGAAIWFNSGFIDPDEERKEANGSSWYVDAATGQPVVAAVGIGRSVGVFRLILSDTCGDQNVDVRLPPVALRGDVGPQGGLAFGAVRLEIVHALLRDLPLNTSVRMQCYQGGLPVRLALYAAAFSMSPGADARAEVHRLAQLVSKMSVNTTGTLADAEWSVRVQGAAVSLSAARMVRSNPLAPVSSGTLYRRINDADTPPLTHLTVNDKLIFPLPGPPGFKG